MKHMGSVRIAVGLGVASILLAAACKRIVEEMPNGPSQNPAPTPIPVVVVPVPIPTVAPTPPPAPPNQPAPGPTPGPGQSPAPQPPPQGGSCSLPPGNGAGNNCPVES